jgi:hypothetical protein
MSRCVVCPETTMRLGRSNLRHVLPEHHVQVYAKAEITETEAEESFLRRNWQWSYAHREYGAFRIDLGRRQLRGMPADEAADRLEANQATWPTHDFTAEVEHLRRVAAGMRVCPACGQSLKPPPPCDCGCLKPVRPVVGFATPGQALAPTPAQKPAQEPLANAQAEEEDDYANPF